MKKWIVVSLDFSGCYYEGDYPTTIVLFVKAKTQKEAYKKVKAKVYTFSGIFEITEEMFDEA